MEEEVKLHGFWASPYSHRVIWALKLKGIKYEYIEEDLSNKSDLLLKYNPVYKKIPVLVHGSKPVAESLVILEYIENAWPHHPLLPTDPYLRALARFRIQFAESKGLIFFEYFRAKEKEAQEKARKEAIEVLKVIEEQVLGDQKFFSGESIGMIDIAYGWLAHWLQPMQQTVGIPLLDPTTFPLLDAWIHNFKQVVVVKENLPHPGKLLAHYQRFRAWIVADD